LAGFGDFRACTEADFALGLGDLGFDFTLAFALGAALTALCPAFPAGLTAFRAGFEACFGVLLDVCFGLGAFVLPAIVTGLN